MSDRSGESARRVALDAMVRIERDDAYANLALSAQLRGSGLEQRDRALVTELVYGTIRQRRACDFLVDRFLSSPPNETARAALRLGAYQLHFTDIPPHAAVSTTVAAVGKGLRGLINAVLRKVASEPVNWPDEPTRLSYPDWIVERLTADLGAERAGAALMAMNAAPRNGWPKPWAPRPVTWWPTCALLRGARPLTSPSRGPGWWRLTSDPNGSAWWRATSRNSGLVHRC